MEQTKFIDGGMLVSMVSDNNGDVKSYNATGDTLLQQVDLIVISFPLQ